MELLEKQKKIFGENSTKSSVALLSHLITSKQSTNKDNKNLDEQIKKKLAKELIKNKFPIVSYFEDKNNLVGFFTLLLRVDKRINPHLYKPIKSIQL